MRNYATLIRFLVSSVTSLGPFKNPCDIHLKPDNLSASTLWLIPEKAITRLVNKRMVKGESEMVLAGFIKAVVLTGHGGLDKLVVHDDLPVPKLKTGEVLIEVGACGMNNTDINTRIGFES